MAQQTHRSDIVILCVDTRQSPRIRDASGEAGLLTTKVKDNEKWRHGNNKLLTDANIMSYNNCIKLIDSPNHSIPQDLANGSSRLTKTDAIRLVGNMVLWSKHEDPGEHAARVECTAEVINDFLRCLTSGPTNDST